MAWRLFGAKPLSEPMLTWFIDICGTRGRWEFPCFVHSCAERIAEHRKSPGNISVTKPPPGPLFFKDESRTQEFPFNINVFGRVINHSAVFIQAGNPFKSTDLYVTMNFNCVSIGSGNGLAFIRHLTTTWTNTDLSTGTLLTNFEEITFKIQQIYLNKNAFENVVCKIWAILSRSHWIKVFHLEAVQSSHLDAVFQNTHKINHLQATSVILIFNVVAEHLIKPSTLFFVSKLLIGYSLFLSIVFSCVIRVRGIGIGIMSVCSSVDHTFGFDAFPCK